MVRMAAPTTTQPPDSPSSPRAPQRRRDQLIHHVGLLVAALVIIGGTGAYLGTRIMGALPDVGKNLDPGDAWGAPLAVERRSDGWLVAHVPPCAQGAVLGLVLWDDHNQPLWELRGQAFPFDQFLVGGRPPGLKLIHALEEPSRTQVLRLGMFRPTGPPAGVTFKIKDLRAGKVHFRNSWLTPDQFKSKAKCSEVKVRKASKSTAATLAPQTLAPGETTTFPSATSPP